MKPISKLFLFIMVVFLLSQCKKDTEPETIITDNDGLIKDENFLNVLKALGVDTDKDGYISLDEAEEITSLNLQNKGISDMTGIEAFVNLEFLDCSENSLTSLDVSNNLSLKELYCNNNDLTSLDVSNNDSIIYLWCYINKLTTLDVSNVTALYYLNCDDNQLSSLDVTSNFALWSLGCCCNQLTSLDISHNTVLEFLDCDDNKLTNLDVSNNSALQALFCNDNQLTYLNVTSLTDLRILECGGNLLISLDLSNNSSLGLGYENTASENMFLSIHNMPSLQKVCVWTMPFPPAGFRLYKEGSPNVYFTIDCSK